MWKYILLALATGHESHRIAIPPPHPTYRVFQHKIFADQVLLSSFLFAHLIPHLEQRRASQWGAPRSLFSGCLIFAFQFLMHVLCSSILYNTVCCWTIVYIFLNDIFAVCFINMVLKQGWPNHFPRVKKCPIHFQAPSELLWKLHLLNSF